MDGWEFTEHLEKQYIWFAAGGILSAVPKGTQIKLVQNYTPYWEIQDFDSPAYQFQTPLTQLELLCYDGYPWVIICRPEMSAQVKAALPMAKTPTEFYKDLKQH